LFIYLQDVPGGISLQIISKIIALFALNQINRKFALAKIKGRFSSSAGPEKQQIFDLPSFSRILENLISPMAEKIFGIEHSALRKGPGFFYYKIRSEAQQTKPRKVEVPWFFDYEILIQ
jgi:hypothetical protein